MWVTETRAKSSGVTVAIVEWLVSMLYVGVNVVRPVSLRNIAGHTVVVMMWNSGNGSAVRSIYKRVVVVTTGVPVR